MPQSHPTKTGVTMIEKLNVGISTMAPYTRPPDVSMAARIRHVLMDVFWLPTKMRIRPVRVRLPEGSRVCAYPRILDAEPRLYAGLAGCSTYRLIPPIPCRISPTGDIRCEQLYLTTRNAWYL